MDGLFTVACEQAFGPFPFLAIFFPKQRACSQANLQNLKFLSHLCENQILQKSCSESSLLTIYTRGAWFQSCRPRYFILSVKRTVDNDSYISKLRSGFKYNCHKIGAEPGKSRDLHTCKERYNRLLPSPFFSLFFFFIFRNITVYIYCWTPEDMNWFA